VATLRVIVESSHRRVTIDLEEDNGRTRLKIFAGSKRGNTTLHWEETEQVILGFVRSLRKDEAITARQQEAIQKTA